MQSERLHTTEGIPLVGPLLITPRVFRDARGFFLESWNQHAFTEILEADGQDSVPFVQDNHSRSFQGVLRGLHYQRSPHAQGKLVRCVAGAIFDVAVDLRLHAPTFGQWAGVTLCATHQQQLWIPAGFAHGFLTMSPQADVLYKTTDFWESSCEQSIRWDDPDLAIAWPLPLLAAAAPQLSEKDAAASFLVDLPPWALPS
ncbi:MAG: dTDP-4-dehydrorhamnose 3,5-epimerase [Cyanobacteriota bacterium]